MVKAWNVSFHFQFFIFHCDNTVNVGDAGHLINYIFKGGEPPYPLDAGDANCDHFCNIADAVYLVNYIFKNGNKPCCCTLCGDTCL